MGNRIIKETIRTSKTVNNMTDFQFRVWTYLITYVDDFGRGSADPEILKGFVFPRRKRVSEKDIDTALADLAGMGCILLYRVDGESYFCFPNWGTHQRIQQKRSLFPAPEDGELLSVGHGEPPLVTVGHGEPPSESESESNSNPNPKGKGNAHPPAKEKQAYGEYANVLLTEAELEALKAEFPAHWQALIDKLSGYMQQHGKTYKDHLATMRNWGRKDGLSAKNQPTAPKMGTLEQEAIRRMMGGGDNG